MPEMPKSQSKPWIAKQEPFAGFVYTTFYNCAPWRRLRLAILAEHPLCKHCEANGIITPATEVDHIKPINPHQPYNTENGKHGEPLDRNNLQTLCKTCHTTKTAKTRGIEIR